MTNKELFIKETNEIINRLTFMDNKCPYSENAMTFLDELNESSLKTTLTENGQKIISYMKENSNKCDNTFSNKMIAEGLCQPTRSISGSMKKLVNDGYIAKISDNPVRYSLIEI